MTKYFYAIFPTEEYNPRMLSVKKSKIMDLETLLREDPKPTGVIVTFEKISNSEMKAGDILIKIRADDAESFFFQEKYKGIFIRP